MKINIDPKILKRIIAGIVCCVVLVTAIYSCNVVRNKKGASGETSIPTQSLSPTVEPTSVPITIVTPTLAPSQEDNKPDEIIELIDDGQVDDIYSLVCSAVSRELSEAGFSVNAGVALSAEKDTYSAIGLYYYTDAVEVFDDPDFLGVGFVEVSEAGSPFYDASLLNDVIYVEDTSEEDEIQRICAYNYNNIGASHCVYKGKYIKYYQLAPMRVVYETYDNDVDFYDLSLGSIYDYDERCFIYDETIFDEYTMHSATELFSNEDYAHLEGYLQQLSDEQLRAGYQVEEYTIVYISPENLQAYLDSEEEDTFFGYSVSELSSAFGAGIALQYTENGFIESKVIDVTSEEYNWKSFLTKMAIGSGIIIVGAVLTPLTGGASFGCALITITKVGVTFALSSGLGTLAVETVRGLIKGHTIENSLYAASHKGLDAFANGFMIGAAIGSVGVVSGVIKPVACFAEGTPVMICDEGRVAYKSIEDIRVGDLVYSYDFKTNTAEARRVLETYVKSSENLVKIYTGNDCIVTTPEHPFFDNEHDVWIEAGELTAGSSALTIEGKTVYIDDVEVVSSLEKSVTVYNLSVEDNHNYFVGTYGVLVHNDCSYIKNLRKKAVNDAWAKEVQAVKNGTSKYNWTSAEKRQLLEFGKIKGYEGHHIIPVNELEGKVGEHLIGSADDIVFLSKKAHKLVHKGQNYSFEGTRDVLVELVPWVSERIQMLLPLAGL